MRQYWDKLIRLGVTPGMVEDRTVVVCTLNVVLTFAIVFSAISVPLTYFWDESARLALLHGVFTVLYAITLHVNGRSKHRTSRMVTILILGMHYVMMNLGWGNFSGVQFYLVGLIFLPLILYNKFEAGKIFAAIGYFIVCAVVSITVAKIFIEIPAAQLKGDDLFYSYQSVLFVVTVMVAGTFAFYRFSDIALVLKLTELREKEDWLRNKAFLQNLFRAPDDAVDDAADVFSDLDDSRRTGPATGPITSESDIGTSFNARKHDEVTVLFADLVGFSAMCETLAAEKVVAILNTLFAQLDKLAKQNGVERIKTIGDCYMVATGVLGEDNGQAENVANFALTIPHAVQQVSDLVDPPNELAVRIGISTGPAISGRTGKEDDTFDVWGETVKMANRMESSGLAGRIRVTEHTYQRLRDKFEFERYENDGKDDNANPSYHLLRRKPNDSE